MFVEVEYTNQSGDVKKIQVNLANIATMGVPDGKKYDSGYRTLMFTANGHALYSRLEPELFLQAFQGRVITENDLEAWKEQADLQLKDAMPQQ